MHKEGWLIWQIYGLLSASMRNSLSQAGFFIDVGKQHLASVPAWITHLSAHLTREGKTPGHDWMEVGEKLEASGAVATLPLFANPVPLLLGRDQPRLNKLYLSPISMKGAQ
jgi:hypothetical protein